MIMGQPGEVSTVIVNAAPVLEIKYMYTPSPVAVNASPFMDTNFKLKNLKMFLYLAGKAKQSVEPS